MKHNKENERADEQTPAAEETAAQGPEEAVAQEAVPEAEEARAETPAEPDPLQKALAEAEDFKRKWYLVTAEYENYRRRTANTAAQRYAEGRADVVKGLFPIADNLGRALDSCKDDATRKGIEMVVKAFEKLLADEKITVIDPVGQPFDADKCEAIMAVDPAEGEESGTVRSVYLKGYEQNGRVLRFAQVIVVK